MSEPTLYRMTYDTGDIELRDGNGDTTGEYITEVEPTDRICIPHLCALPIGWQLDKCWAILDGVAKDASGYDSGEVCHMVDVARVTEGEQR